MNTLLIAESLRDFIRLHPHLAGYTAFMLALAMTGRIKLVLMGGVLGLIVFYAYHVSLAIAAGQFRPYHAIVGLLISIAVMVVTAKYAFR